MTNQTLSILFPAAVRERILEQHRALRDLLQRALEATTNSLRAGRPNLDAIARLIHDLRARFRAHLAFEEVALAPVLAHLDLWGPERVQALLAEHARQRAELDTLVGGIEEAWDVERLAFALRSLVTDLLLDMQEEERGCVSAGVLRDQMMMVGTMRE